MIEAYQELKYIGKYKPYKGATFIALQYDEDFYKVWGRTKDKTSIPRPVWFRNNSNSFKVILKEAETYSTLMKWINTYAYYNPNRERYLSHTQAYYNWSRFPYHHRMKSIRLSSLEPLPNDSRFKRSLIRDLGRLNIITEYTKQIGGITLDN